MSTRRKTATSNFGVSRREAHDASAFYARFAPPVLSDDEAVAPPPALPAKSHGCIEGDARRMQHLPDDSVALVVTSPPYFAGKQYEEELEREGVPASYLEYLDLLRDVFAECVRVLEPGGRIAVNVANLGRKPYRSLSADVIRILQDDLGLLLRGEVVWRKGEGASGNCAWGSFRKAGNPVLRDITERVVIASKGRFDRAVPQATRAKAGLPSENTVSSDEFMAATLDVWELPTESAKRVGHPAPFPVELPERLIRLYTYKDDLVLDPFLGSGSTLVAAARTGRRGVGYDLDKAYVRIARQRVAAEAKSPASAADEVPDKPAHALAEELVAAAGFTVVKRNARLRGLGLTVALLAKDDAGREWCFDVTGAFTVPRNGLAKTQAVWAALGRAHVLAANGIGPFVLLTSHLPKPRTEGDLALRAAGPNAFFDAMELRSDTARERLEKYALGGHQATPVVGFWTDADLQRR
ncbi:MAG TPA: site-specific DNA-methyltransferase [Acidimicrobiales bacterium]|jgi:site-specific DNA-methyltransferase (adenine-specific)|nr:site-specific DNA-methyltransferase [Acidimicrobiales bacterium]